MVFCFQLLVPGLLFLALYFGLSAFGFPGSTFRSWLLGLGFLVLAWWLQLVGLGLQTLIFQALARGFRLFRGLVVGFWHSGLGPLILTLWFCSPGLGSLILLFWS